MKVRAKIALCTLKGARRRDEVFLVDAAQGAAWVRAGKVEEVPEEVPPTGTPRAKRPGAPPRRKRTPKPAAPAAPVTAPDAPPAVAD